MYYDFLSFPFNFFCFFDLFHKRKVILIDLRWSFLNISNFRHIISFYIIFLLIRISSDILLILLIIFRNLIIILFFSLWLITNDTSLWPWGHKRPIRIDFLLNLILFNKYLLLYNLLFRYKIFFSMFIRNC